MIRLGSVKIIDGYRSSDRYSVLLSGTLELYLWTELFLMYMGFIGTETCVVGKNE